MHMGVQRELKPRGMTPGCWFPAYGMAITTSMVVLVKSSAARYFTLRPADQVSLPRATTSKPTLVSVYRAPRLSNRFRQ
ncbi:hypothetical protein BDW42DRAFT_174977 [Aspergillus taichungensis]|uniref:Uncharacterized protein n=1 Tax=Aspergillus taichungensis TaxID=482145 RepID=A0A2J5HML3_9EURO|nr:hypothetical protein BDW42DRAFT_174977 [Aspergillus taichungensis]